MVKNCMYKKIGKSFINVSDKTYPIIVQCIINNIFNCIFKNISIYKEKV